MFRRVLAGFLFALLVIAPAFSETTDGLPLPDASYTVVREAEGEEFVTQIYIKDGKMYMEMSGLLWDLGDALDFILDELVDHLAAGDLEELFEVEEVGTEVIGEWETSHWQVRLKETGALVSEMWQADDVFVSVKRISYDEEGNVASREILREFSLEPDFSGLDFSEAPPLFFTAEPEVKSLTKEEFQELVPWYDVEKPFPGGFELRGIRVRYESMFEQYGEIVLEYFNGEKAIELMIFGARDGWAAQPKFDDLLLLLHTSKDGIRLEPAVLLENSKVILGFIDPVHIPTAESFLRSVVLFR